MEHNFFVTCLIIQNDQILMLEKEKGRHIGTWLFPGGAMNDGESPLDAVIREITRETGLTLDHIELRGITSFILQENPEDDVLARTNLFVFYTEHVSGELKQSNRGKLVWVPLEDIWNRKLGRNDHLFLPPMLQKREVTFATFYHNKEKELVHYHIK